ncbi:MAG TPA: VWA domain-containing protein, partial [Blastocatellia bacterium]|nr:VWA domain-containing protein [Blastocatellia bacterium]
MRIHRRLRKLDQLFLVAVMAVLLLAQIVAQDSRPSSQSRPGTQSKPDPARKDDPPPDTGGDPIKIDTQLVQLDVTVVDQKNNPVFNLGKNDFTVFEDRIQQVINSVSREEVPLSFGIVVDTSGSMRSRLQTVSDAARDLFKQMRADDECFLTQFKTETELVSGFSSDPVELDKSLDQLFTSGGTALLDAIIATSDYAQNNGKRRRKAIIVISDGLEKNSGVKEKEVIKAIKENEVQLYLIGLLDEEDKKSFFGSSSNRKAQNLLSGLADDSGGRAFFPKSLSEIPGISLRLLGKR